MRPLSAAGVADKRGLRRPVGLPPPTPETLARASAARAAKRVGWKLLSLKRYWLDAGEWDRLASERGIRQPSWDEPLTTGRMRTYLGRLGISATAWLDYTGFSRLADYVERNPRQPLRAWLGTVLEAIADGRLRFGGQNEARP